MKNTTEKTMATANEAWGLWGTAEGNGMPVQATWDAAFAFFRDRYAMHPIDTRNLLDSRFGRHLADRLAGYISGFPQFLAGDLQKGLEWVDANWRRWVENSIRTTIANRTEFPAPTEDEDDAAFRS